MSAPAGIDHTTALAQLGRALADALLSAAERQAAMTIDPAGSAWPLASAPDATTPAPSRPKATRAPLEDSRHELTSAAD